MKKKLVFPVIGTCGLLASFCLSAAECETAVSPRIPATGDVASVVALTLVGLAAIGGLLLRRSR